MICLSIGEGALSSILVMLDNVQLAELRLDMLALTIEEVQQLFSHDCKMIATCREGNLSPSERFELLKEAIKSGADYVDVDIDMEEELAEAVLKQAEKYGAKVIMSFHDHERTRSRSELDAILESCFAKGADLSKIACQVNDHKDASRLLGLLDNDNKIIVIGMGPKGRFVRLAAPMLGAPFTYACVDRGSETADGQIPYGEMVEMYEVLGGNR